MTAAPVISETSVPSLPNGVRLHFDGARDRWVLLAPERLFVLDPIALDIVKRCDGQATVGRIVEDLAAAYSAPRSVVLDDVTSLLQDFAEKKVLAA